MVYFTSQDIAAISICAALWGVLNVAISPVFFSMTRLPFACDLIGFTCLLVAIWWTKKFGTATSVGLISTLINFVLRPGTMHFIGFTAASLFLDVTTKLAGYETCFGNSKSSKAILVGLPILSGALAGSLIGGFFMAPGMISSVYGTVFVFAGLHAFGGLIGGILGIILIEALEIRGIKTHQT